MPEMLNPASRAEASEASMVPPLQTALVVTAELTSMTALSSRSVKERVPLLERACAEAFCVFRIRSQQLPRRSAGHRWRQ